LIKKKLKTFERKNRFCYEDFLVCRLDRGRDVCGRVESGNENIESGDEKDAAEREVVDVDGGQVVRVLGPIL
jgi:hypothetical protein